MKRRIKKKKGVGATRPSLSTTSSKKKKTRKQKNIDPYVEKYAEANRRLKSLKQSKSEIDTYMLNRATEILGALNKRTFNTRNLTKPQKVTLNTVVDRFLNAKTSTVRGAKEVANKKEQALRNRISHLYGFKESSYQKIVTLLRHYSINELAFVFGYADQESFWVELIDYVNNTRSPLKSLDARLSGRLNEVVDQIDWENTELRDDYDTPETKLRSIRREATLRKVMNMESGAEVDDFIQEAFNAIR